MRFNLKIVTPTRTIVREGLTKVQMRTWVESWVKDSGATEIVVTRVSA